MPASASARPIALVTGASRGIGRVIAEELATDHHLLLGGRDRTALEALAAELPSAEPFAADLTDPHATARAVDAIDRSGTGALGQGQGLSALVHSAGILVAGSIADLTAEDWNRSLAVNVTAVAELTRLLLPTLRRARGTVVTLNSASGLTSSPNLGAYCASKFALRALTDALRAEERPHGVRVSSIHPGRVDAGMQTQLRDFEGADYRGQDYLSPASVAAAVGLAVRATPEASIDEITLRPRG